MKVCLVCIAKNEDYYIDEWIEYNQKIGFDKIIIYENNWRYSKIKNNVIKIPFDGEEKQIPAYNHFLTLCKDYDWAAFFDVDEFICLKKHKDIKSFIKDYEKYPAIAINWFLFGDNGLKEVCNEEYSVLKRFTKRQDAPNKHIKSILNLKFNHFTQVHNSITGSVDTNHKFFYGPFNENGPVDVAQINHYFCKTKPEFIKKLNRGRADFSIGRQLNEFEEHNFNDVEDLTAYNFLYEKNNI
jgi:hypothetical protein